ncbi:recombinase RecT [Holdemania sp. Marseille-P2844]|uniref:recombinase RecT n=1 Tax=Holdemania sp. Marseille-P2844 TaxID=1852366 RepID=UPI0009FA44E3|nr:recombinase RecT [Holdemania sp. Marseille-P2844]
MNGQTVNNKATSITKAAESAVEGKKKGNITLKDYVVSMQGEIAKALPKVMTPERFTRIALSAISSNKKLAECTPQSFLAAMMNAAQLGLEPNTPLGQAYLIPYKSACTFQLGYKGLIDLAYRSGEVKTIMAQTVYENDEFDFEFGLTPKLHHVPAKSNRGNPVWFYAVFKTVNGGEGFEVMSVEDVKAHAKKYSKSYSDGPWQTNFEEMAKKTVLKKALKYAPIKTEFVRQIETDETIKSDISDDMTLVPNENEIYEAEVENEYSVDQETGEVKGKAADQPSLL